MLGMDASTLITVLTSTFAFVGGLVASYIAWKNSHKQTDATSEAELREDLMTWAHKLNEQMETLRERIRKLEEEVINKNREILNLQKYIGRIAQALVREHNLHLDDIVKDKY